MATADVATVTPPAERKTRVYEVSSLDTIHSIALKFKMTTGELLRLNGLPSTYRIYSGQNLTVFENATSGAPEVVRAGEKQKVDLMESTRASIESLRTSKEAVRSTGLNGSSNTTNTDNQATTVEVEFNFGNVITPSYRSVPLLVTLRQSREKKYFAEVKTAQSNNGAGGISDSLTATMARQNSSGVGNISQRPFTSIPEEMRLNSRDLVKEHVRYYMNEQRNVFGELTLMPSTLIFEPALDDPVTRQIGLMNCQFQCDLKDILDVQVIEAAEMLGWWKSKKDPNSREGASSNSGNNGNSGYDSYGSTPAVSRESSREVSSTSPAPSGSPSTTHRPRTHSMNHGPSSSHLNTGLMTPDSAQKSASGITHFAANVNVSPAQSPSKQLLDARLDRLDEEALRFLQLTVLMPAPVSSASGRSASRDLRPDLIASESSGVDRDGNASDSNAMSSSAGLNSSGGGQVDIWCAQARPSSANNRKTNQHSNNILKPQPTLYERMAGTASDDNKKAVPIFGAGSDSKPSSSHSGNSSPSGLGAPTHNNSGSTVMEVDLPKLNLPSALITTDGALMKLAAALPTRYRHSDWTNLYSTERHGVSLTTFFNKTKRKGPTYLIVEDDAGFCFGAYLSDSWEPQKSYYGTGECFLFTLYPSFNVYPWSQLNEYFIYSREDTIALGGGSGKFALWLDKDLACGSSAPCDTFLNSTLSYQEDFKPTVVEVWGFNDAISKA